MTYEELTDMINYAIQIDKKDPHTYRPLVAIGHTKDLNDLDTIQKFLMYLENREINITTLKKAYNNCLYFPCV